MGRAKIAIRGKVDTTQPLPEVERWTVIGTDENLRAGRALYLASEKGIGQEEAEKLAERMSHARAVPRMSLDRFDRYDASLYEKWQEASAEAQEEE